MIVRENSLSRFNSHLLCPFVTTFLDLKTMRDMEKCGQATERERECEVWTGYENVV